MIYSKSQNYKCSFSEGSEERGLRQSGRGEAHGLMQLVLF